MWVVLAMWWVLGFEPSEVARPPTQVVLPATGYAVSGLPGELRWEVDGVVTLTDGGEQTVDRLMAWSDDKRLVTIEVRRRPCPARSPATSPAWPRYAYQSLREAVPGELAVHTCKQPDQDLTLRFPAGTPKDSDLLIEEADRFEPAVIALHDALSSGALDLSRALALRDRLTFARGEGAPADVVQALALPMSLRVGATTRTRGMLALDRGNDRTPWVMRTLGPHDTLVLVAPTAARLMLQLIPFDARTTSCEVALDYAVKGQPVARPDAWLARTPPGWDLSRPVGAENAAFCIRSEGRGGLVVIGGARVPRESWLPVAMPILSRLGEALERP